MTLSEYLQANGLRQEEFAARMGVAQATVSRWCNGLMPRRAHLLRIIELTGGAVTAEAFLEDRAA